MITDVNDAFQRFEVVPTQKQLLGRFTIYLLVLNRTIGSGIFAVPPKVLSGTGSVGGSLFIWFSCGIIVICGTLCWLELGLTIPFVTIRDQSGEEEEVSAPRSGGEKNFVSFPHPSSGIYRLLTPPSWNTSTASPSS